MIEKSRKKIAFVDPGSFTLPYDKKFLNALVNIVDVDFFCSDTLYGAEDFGLVDSRVKIIKLKVSGSVAPRFIGICNYIILLTVLFLKKKTYDAIHFNWSLVPFFDKWLLPLLFREKLVFTVHNVIPHGRTDEESADYLRLIENSETVISLSEYVFFELRSRGIKSYLLQHGITKKILEPKNEEIRKILLIGRVELYKGIESYVKLACNVPNLNFEIIGKWGEDSEYLKKTLPKNVKTVEGYISSKKYQEILNRRDTIICFPYRTISQSGVMYDAIASCVPFVASATGEFVNVAKKIGHTNILFDPESNEDFARAVDYVINNSQCIRSKLSLLQKEYLWDYDDSLLLQVYGGNL